MVSMPNRPSHPFDARTERKSKRKADVGPGVAVLVRRQKGSDLGHDERMLNKCDIRGGDDGELHREHLSIGVHPGSWNDCVPKGDDILDGLAIHQVRGAFHLDDGLVCADGVVAVLEIEAKSEMGSVLEKDVANRAVDDVINERGLYMSVEWHKRSKYVWVQTWRKTFASAREGRSL
jgi:hypothetical protein